MGIKEVLEGLGILVAVIGSILAALKFWSLVAEVKGYRKERDEIKLSCGECRKEVLLHHQNTAVHRDPTRDQSLLQHIENTAIHRDPIRDENAWNDLVRNLNEFRREMSTRLLAVERAIRSNGHMIE